MPIEHLNPDGLMKNPAFSQAVVVRGSHRTIYVGGQNALDGATRSIVGVGDLRAQTRQAAKNVRTALAAGGAELAHLVKLTIYIVQGQDAAVAFAASQEEWGVLANQPSITGLFVAGLAHPDFMIEIDAIAAVPE
ncbi:MAG: RidA family protein [Kofleriaceae bacterium]